MKTSLLANPARLLADGIVVLPAFFLAIALISTSVATPFQRDFDVNDFSISHPFATKEIVPGNLLIVESTIAPALVLAAWAYYRQLSLREIVYALNCMLTAITMTMAITDTTKEFVGELRPDFLSRCAPVKDDAGKYVCTGDTKFVNEGRASFPSGHSSLSFAGWFSLILFANGTMSPLLRRNAWIKTVLVLLIVPAAFTALSRSRDYRHHWQDIFVGSLLGTVVAYFWYHVTYHPPSGVAIPRGKLTLGAPYRALDPLPAEHLLAAGDQGGAEQMSDADAFGIRRGADYV